MPAYTSTKPLILPFLLLLSSLWPAEGPQPIPRIEKANGQVRLIVDNAPFLMLGGQVHNSTNSNLEQLNKALDSLVGLHANSAEVPIYWESIEPAPGQFDFRIVDGAVQAARKRGLRLILLWFGTWKNGESYYAPEWIRRDKTQFQRVTGASGEQTAIISPLSARAQEADQKAFAAMMRHIRSIDEVERTVIMVQVENESGLVGTDRDYSVDGTRLFQGPVPNELISFLNQNRERLTSTMTAAWAASAFRKTGGWSDIFGALAPEVFSAWYVARYVNAVASAGKKEYPLPMYANAWLIEGGERAGRWPSGGPTEHVLDVWKAAAPALDILAPDIYYPKFHDICTQYSRSDNVLFVPETNYNPYFAGFAFTTFAEFNGIGFSPFGIDDAIKDGMPSPEATQFEDSYRVLRPLLPLIAQYQYTGKMHSVLQGIAAGEDWVQSFRVGSRLAAHVEFTVPFNPEKGRARGLLIELAADTFLVVGAGFRVEFRELEGPLRNAEVLFIEEGSFEGNRWVPSRRLNGDERAVSLPERSTILMVKILE